MLYPKKILLGIQEGSCNLKCPKCYTHGANKISTNSRAKGLMDFDQFKLIIDELSEFKPRIAPQTWDEPLLNKNIFSYLEVIKSKRLPITMDTNGLLLNDEKINNLINLKVDSVFISLDALNCETYKKVRGIDKLNELKELIFLFLQKRGSYLFPRIGVSFVKEEENKNEVSEFVKYWMNHVDVVRVNEKFGEKRTLDNEVLNSSKIKNRKPCWSIYDSLMIHFNGEASLCCVDTHYENQIGNVFNEGVLKLWNGHFFNQARIDHENLNFSKLATCEKCQLWRHDQPEKSISENWLISQTTTHAYYNRLDKTENMLVNRFV